MTLPLTRLLCLPLFLVMVATPPVRAEQTPWSLEEQMSHAEFMRLGLDRLSPEQLGALNEWLRSRGSNGPSMDTSKTGTTLPQSDVESRLVGDFRGWEYGTVFKLENGQSWQVTEDTPMTIRSIPSPRISVRKGFFGNWLFSIEGVSETVHVTPGGV